MGAATPKAFANPGFNEIHMDYDTLLPTKIYTHSMDLATANANDSPTWGLLHDYIGEYSLTDLSPRSMLGLSNQIKNN
jgi:hypothetical protein